VNERECILFIHYDIFPGQMSNVNHRGPYVAPLEKWFQRRRFLEIHQSETKLACGGHVC
jgi:hypothetical protein